MKRVYCQFFTLALVLIFVSSIVMAQDTGLESLNQLLLDGSTEVSVSEIRMTDSFDKTSTWETYDSDSMTLEISKGAYRMFSTGNSYVWGLNGRNGSDTVVQVKTIQNSDENANYYGVICRADPSNNGNGYYFEITGDGYYAIARVTSDDFHFLVDWNQSKAINKGKNTNEIIAVCVSNYLALYVNEVLVAETTDTTFSQGQTGLQVGAFEEKDEVDVSFDDVKVWHASSKNEFHPAQTEGIPVALENMGGRSEDAIAELENLGLIPSGSTLIFGENYAYFTGQGSWFTPLASRSPRKNIVAGAELTFTVGNNNAFELCTLTARINTNTQGDAITYVDVGIGNDGLAYVFDRFSETQDTSLATGSTTLDLIQAHNILFLLIDDKATVYVDGRLEISEFTIAERSGSYGIALLGEGPKAKCEGRNIWAYAIPSVKPGECVINANSAVNKRTGPGTNFDAAGQLTAGEDVPVIGQNEGDDGKVWWQLDDENWVRSDVVNAVGDCADVPTVN